MARAFANVCRHRGSRLVDGESGCAKVLTCPYHAWSYARDGRLVGVPHRQEYPGLETEKLGLKPVALEEWRGFLFVRLEEGLPSVAEMMAPYEAEVAPYRFEDLRAIGRVTLGRASSTGRPSPTIIPTICTSRSAIPGLTRLFGRNYRIEAEEWVDRMEGELVEAPSGQCRRAGVPAFAAGSAGHLPASHRASGSITSCSPASPSTSIPTRSTSCSGCRSARRESVIREISYALPDERREMRAARYLNWRINRRVNAEDTVLISRVQAGMESASYEPGPLGDERGLPAELRGEAPRRSFPRRGWSGRRRSGRATNA